MDLRDQLQETLGESLLLEDELGGGGMSRVFVARDPVLNRRVVVKVLPPEMSGAVNIDRFRREIQLAAQLQHPHIVPLLAAGETDGLPYFTMPYVRGESLRARLAKGGELPVSETVRMLREIASALAYAHEAGIVHRDIKPENVLVSGGSAVVTDFGVAKALSASSGVAGAESLTSMGVALGTPAYMAPEQATADPHIDQRADIYALGVMAYEMLTGSTPFPGRSPQGTLAAHVTEQPEPVTRRRATVPPQLATLVMRCLEKRAADRPQSANDVMNALDALTTPSGGMEPTAKVHAVGRSTGVPRWIYAVGGVVLLVALGFALSRLASRGGISSAEAAEAPAIAVIPFESVGRAEGQEFADGMTEEITNRLSSLSGLRVIGRQSAKEYAGTSKPPQQIASELGVKYLLTGTIRWDRSSDGRELVRVSPALLKADDATQVWANAYQTVMSGMFEVQSKVATDVAEALNLKLLAPERTALAERPTENLEAHGLHLRARDMLASTVEPGRIPEPMALLEKATTLDPRFVEAWAWLAIAHTEYFWYWGDRSSERLAMAKKALDRALALEEKNADAQIARALYHYHGFREYEKALAAVAEAERLRPSDDFAQVLKGAVYRRLGRWENAIDAFKRAVELDPRNGANAFDLAGTYIWLYRYREAEEMLDRALVLSPQEPAAHNGKVLIALGARGDMAEAVRHLRAGVTQVSPPGSAIKLLEDLVGVAVEDAQLRTRLERASWSPEMGDRTAFYRAKAWLFRLTGDSARMRACADSVIGAVNVQAREREDAEIWHEAAQAYAMLGKREQAMRSATRVEMLVKQQKDAFVVASTARMWAALILGDHDDAITMLQKMKREPGGYDSNRLRLDRRFEPLRGNPRFAALIAD